VSDAAIPVASSDPRGFVRAGSVVVFNATDAAHGGEVWRSDATAEGTFLLRDFREGPEHSFVQIVGNGRRCRRTVPHLRAPVLRRR
jgi:ELWxxDGT repeat protein